MADEAIQGLHETSIALAAAIRRFHSHLDEAMARFDRGYLGVDGSHVKGADSGVAGARADLILAATRRFTAFRMLAAAREPGYDPPPVQDLEQIQKLIAEARRRADASSAVLRRLLQVSVNDIDQRRDAEAKDRHERLLKERTAAEDAAKKAFLELPLALPDAASPEESHRKAWELLLANQPLPPKGAKPPSANIPEAASLRPAARQLCTLVEDTSLRMAITDAGIRDKAGRHVFYQEEWIQRGPVVARLRWRVAVDTVNGFHILIKSYPPVELRGTLDDVYQPRDRFNLWYQEPDADATEPPRADITAAMGETTHSREAIRAAVADFRSTIHEAQLLDDRRHGAAAEATLDADLSPDLRETLFAIRGHMAGVPGIVDAGNKVRRAIEQAAGAVERLQALARWGNHIAEPGSPPDQLQWDWVLDRVDREIDLVRTARADALAALPPDNAAPEATFPALGKDLVVRIRRLPGARYRQEIWRREGAPQEEGYVRRIVTLLEIDTKTGSQNRLGGRMKMYEAAAGESVEAVYEEFAAQEINIDGPAEQLTLSAPPRPATHRRSDAK